MAKTTKTLKKTANKTAASTAPGSTTAPVSAQPAKSYAAATTTQQPSLNKPLSTTSVIPAKPTVTAHTPVPKPAPTAPSAAPILSPSAPVAQIGKPTQIKPQTPERNHICLELVKPDAKSVFVAGSFNEWNPDKTPLLPAGNGRWVGDLRINPGRHEYLFVVDGQWVPDPNAKETVGNPFGGKNSVMVVSE